MLILAGFAGSILPALPGPPLAFSGMLLAHFTSYQPISVYWLIAYAVMVIVIAMADLWLPGLATKLTNGSKQGIRGANAGMIIGLFVPIPFAVFIGAFTGSVIGELMSGKNQRQAIVAALGVFIGLLGGIVMKCLLCLAMLLHLIFALVFQSSDTGAFAFGHQF